MNARDYNARERAQGRFRDEHIEQLVSAFQDATSGLKVDGKFGPETSRALERAWAPTRYPDHLQTPGKWGLRAVTVAVSEIGKGEMGGNNSGPHVEKYHRMVWDGDDDDDGAWCAAFVSWCFQQAAELADEPMPFQYTGGAKRLYRRVGEAGLFVPDVSLAQPGDVACWHRGAPGAWTGHVGIVTRAWDRSGLLHTVEGNSGRFPAKVRVREHAVDDEPSFIGLARV